MRDADRIFLNDFMNFTFKNHMMAVEALLEGGGPRIGDYAVRYLRRENPALSEVEAVALERETNERARFQRVMFAKIFAEFVGAVEDFGGFCSAIRHRGEAGMLPRYLESQPREVATFFDDVLQNPEWDLGTLLNLPDIGPLKSKFNGEDYPILASHYLNAPKHIAAVARVYRTTPLPEAITDLASPPANWNELVQILVEVPGVQGIDPARGLVPQMFNKVKHRFMLIESVEEYSKLPEAKQYKAVSISTKWEVVKSFIGGVRRASMGIAEIAATIKRLDEAGVSM